MKVLLILVVALLLTSSAMAIPGDIIRSQAISGQPYYGVRGLAMDWDAGRIWVAGPVSAGNVMFTSMDPVTMSPDTWIPAPSLNWVFDIACGFDYDTYTNCLLLNDHEESYPYTRIVDPATGTEIGSLPDYYSHANYTDGASVNWDNNDVILSSYGDPDVVLYDGAAHSTFATIPGAKNMGAAIGWGHVFVIRSNDFYTIEVYTLDGAFVESIPLNDWSSSNYLMGLSCGQEDVVGDNESLFFASFVSYQVYEVEVGDYTGSALQQATWGEIKGSFR